MRIDDKMMNAIVSYMNDDVREKTHFAMAPCSNEAFLIGYLAREIDGYKADEFADLLRNEFNIEVSDIYENLSADEYRLAIHGIRS